MADYLVTDTELTSVADAIREKGGTTEPLSFPAGFVSAVESIQAGASEPDLQEKTAMPTTAQQEITPDSGYDGLSKVTISAVKTAVQATPEMTLSSRSAQVIAKVTQEEGYVSGGTKSATYSLTKKVGGTIKPGTSKKVAVASGVYTTGTVYVDGDANLVAGNIKSGVSIFGVSGTYAGETPTAKNLYFSKIHTGLALDLESGYLVITMNKSSLGAAQELVYVDGMAYNPATAEEVRISATRVGTDTFLASVYSSADEGFYEEEITFVESETSTEKTWKWMIDPEITYNASMTITTLVFGA